MRYRFLLFSVLLSCTLNANDKGWRDAEAESNSLVGKSSAEIVDMLRNSEAMKSKQARLQSELTEEELAEEVKRLNKLTRDIALEQAGQYLPSDEEEEDNTEGEEEECLEDEVCEVEEVEESE